MKDVLVILGRFGDIFMVCKAHAEPAIIACLPEYASIVYELFPHHEVFQLPSMPKNNPIYAACVAEQTFPEHRILVPQLDGFPNERCKPYRSYQSYQMHHAIQ